MTYNEETCFVLRADGRVHTSDVRCVSSANDLILTASRDGTAMILQQPVSDSLEAGLSMVGHTAFVNFAFYHPSIALLGGGACIVTGGNDNHIALWNPETSALEAVIDGHAHGVCCGAALSPSGDIVTGDWGGVCLIFDSLTGTVKLSYEKHGTAIRALAPLPTTHMVVSASGDKTVHQWDTTTGATKGIFLGHLDVVQSICAISATRFASGSNDATIIIWDTTTGSNAPLCVLTGHDSLVFALSYNPVFDLLLSASEDRSVKVWSGTGKPHGEAVVVQNINHPCVVWSVCATASGDIISGGADGFVRIWTRNEDHMASVEKLEALEASVAAQEVDVKVTSIAGLDPASMPRVDELQGQQGTREGERRFARAEDGSVEVFIWSSGRWDKVGTVVAGPERRAYTGAPLPKEKKYHNGVAYDYVFDVEVSGKMLKLSYNVGQSIFDASQRFINENTPLVSQEHKEEIQNFILQNIDPADAAQLGGGGGGGGVPVSTANAPNVGGNGEALFSEFARESAAMRQAGINQTPSWTEALRNMESTGAAQADVAFSNYAREGMLIQQQQQQHQQQRQHPADAASLTIAAWDSYKCFTTFNAAGAQRKITELTGDPSCGDIVTRVQSAAEPDATIIHEIIALYERLPAESRFPALDLLLHLLATCTTQTHASQRWALLFLRDATAARFMETRIAAMGQTPDTETLLTARIAAQLTAALGTPMNPTADAIPNAEAAIWRQCALHAPQPLLRAGSPPLRAAFGAMLRNTAVLLTRCAGLLGEEATQAAVQGVLRIAAQWFIFESAASAHARELLATLLTLVQSDTTAAVTIALGRGPLAHSMRAICAGPDATSREAAIQVLHAFDEGEAP